MSMDARIPVTLVASPPDAADSSAAMLLAEPGLAMEGPVARFQPGQARHRFGCTCCGGRSAAAEALDRLFQARARGTCPWFERVVAVLPTEAARAELKAALREDRMVAARFRAADRG